jgi:hypothetical protein
MHAGPLCLHLSSAHIAVSYVQYSCMNEDDSTVCSYRNTNILNIFICIVHISLAGNILLATPLRMSPIYDLRARYEFSQPSL